MFSKMKSLIVAWSIFIIITVSSSMVECATRANVCKDISSKSIELQLRTHLFCDYDSDVRPDHDKNNATNVSMTIMPKIIKFDDYTNSLTVHCWTAMNWTDPFLKWDASDFENLDTLHVKSSEIWTPDFKVHNAGDASESQSFPDTDCSLFRDGSVICVPAIKYVAHCDSDYTNFPYDVQICTIELSSWSYSSDEVNVHFGRAVMTDYTPNQQWKVLDLVDNVTRTSFKMNETYDSNLYTVQFTLQRQASAVHAMTIVPAIASMVLTLTVLWLDCNSAERMIVASISFIVHLRSMQYTYYITPHNGGTSPNLLRFYENSFLINGLTLVLTVLLRELRSLTTRAPAWLSGVTSLVLRSRPGQLLLLSILDPKASAFLETSASDSANLVQSRNDDDDEDKKSDSTWAYVTLIIGWLAFVSAFFAYVIMLGIFMPSDRV